MYIKLVAVLGLSLLAPVFTDVPNVLNHVFAAHSELPDMLKYNLSMLIREAFNKETMSKLKGKILTPCVEAYKNISASDFLKYIDAEGKVGSGVTFGNVFMLGSYEECIGIKDAHYCAMSNVAIIKSTVFQPIHLGICAPKECSASDITALLTDITSQTKKYLPVYVVGKSAVCYTDDKHFSNGAIVMICISALLGLICFIGTITDIVKGYVIKYRNENVAVYVKHNDTPVVNTFDEEDKYCVNEISTPVENISMHPVQVYEEHFLVSLLMCFSVIKNSKALFNTDIPHGAITSINGIRTLSITWVVLGHTLFFGFRSFGNTISLYGWFSRWTFQAITNATVSVDSFFLMSGLLVGYLSMKRYNADGKLPLLRYYLHRYIRLTPSYAYCVFFLAYLFPILSSGPLWFMVGPDSGQSQQCISYWWTNLLYINNLTKVKDLCFDWSWYLSNDMQFYIISPIILWFMYKFKWIGVIAANGILLVVCLILNATLMDKYQAWSVGQLNSKHNGIYDPKNPSTQYMLHIYMKPYTRIAPYVIGLVLGYILINKYTIKSLKYVFYTIGWLTAITMALAVIYGPFSATKFSWTEAHEIAYGVFFRNAWAISVGWVIFACHTGFGGLVNEMMSWSAFIPLSRLSYAVYLVHPMVIQLLFFSAGTPVNITITAFVFYFIGITVISFMVAYVISVCIEYPVFNLEKLLLKF